MNFMIAAYSDIGIKKQTNQDSILVKVADTICGKVCLSVICDGMGGLSKGELASATVIRAFDNWFLHDLPKLLEQGLEGNLLRSEWDNLIHEQNLKISAYGKRNNARLGTTLVAILFVNGRWYITNVGDSRVYELTDDIYQLTKDQTFIQREMELGHMNYEEAMRHPQRNMLLQCVGASEILIPDFFEGTMNAGSVFLLCSDGFRHVIEPIEIYQKLNPYVIDSEEKIQASIIDLIELDKYRRETDNISAAVVKTI